MRRKLGSLLLSVLLLTVLKGTAVAAEVSGSIRVTLRQKDAEVALCYAGSPTEGGYRLTEAFGSGFIREEDVDSPLLAQWLAETAEDGEHRLLDADGCADFSNLEAGVYLLRQTEPTGEVLFSPFLIELPYEGQWHIQANPQKAQSPRTGQSADPFLGAAGMVLSGTGLILLFLKKCKRR